MIDAPGTPDSNIQRVSFADSPCPPPTVPTPDDFPHFPDELNSAYTCIRGFFELHEGGSQEPLERYYAEAAAFPAHLELLRVAVGRAIGTLPKRRALRVLEVGAAVRDVRDGEEHRLHGNAAQRVARRQLGVAGGRRCDRGAQPGQRRGRADGTDTRQRRELFLDALVRSIKKWIVRAASSSEISRKVTRLAPSAANTGASSSGSSRSSSAFGRSTEPTARS